MMNLDIDARLIPYPWDQPLCPIHSVGFDQVICWGGDAGVDDTFPVLDGYDRHGSLVQLVTSSQCSSGIGQVIMKWHEITIFGGSKHGLTTMNQLSPLGCHPGSQLCSKHRPVIWWSGIICRTIHKEIMFLWCFISFISCSVHQLINYSYGPLPVISTYNPIYRMYNPTYNQL